MADEWWDVVDRDGVPTGRLQRRADEDFPEGFFHVVASVCVLRRDGYVLVTRRAVVKDWPLFWEFPAGSLLASESSEEGAVRELAEETGVRVDVDDLELVGRVIEERVLFDLYLVRVSDDPGLALDPSEVCQSEWVTFVEVLSRCAAGEMAGPWMPRLTELGDRLAELIDR